jgi:L-ascorbate peroxidase
MADYEVDFIDYFTLLAGLGTFKKDAYLHPEAVVAIRF